MTIHTIKKLRGSQGLSEAVALLRAGECVGLPTETVYGLAALADSDHAVRRIFDAKGRPADHPLIVHLPSVEHLAFWASDIPASVWVLAETFWPGPLTLLLRKNRQRSDVVTGGRDTVAVRVPSHPLFLEVLTRLDQALAAPSANLYRQLSPTTADQVVAGLDGRIPAVLDGGPSEFGLESTILDLVADRPAILRSGPVGRDVLEKALGETILLPGSHDVAVPGNVAAHYQPKTPMRTVSKQDLISMDIGEMGVIVWSRDTAAELPGSASPCVRDLSEDPVEFGRALYQTLAELDRMELKQLLVEMPPQTEAWAAINDRLRRASGTF